MSATDADSAIASIAITSAPVTGITLTGTGAGTARLDVAGNTAAGGYDVTIRFATDDDPAQETTCTIRVTVEAPPVLTPIAEVQGSGAVSPIVGQNVAVEAVVTSTFTRQDVPDGFFVQSAVGDGDSGTSDGVFVFCRGACPVVAVGDLVRVRGEVTEFFGMTQVEATTRTNGRITTLSSGNPLPEATAVGAPPPARHVPRRRSRPSRAWSSRSPARWPSASTSSSPGTASSCWPPTSGRTSSPTTTRPSGSGYATFLADLATRRIILDDDNNDQNDAVSTAADEAFPYPTRGLSLTNRVRGGDTIEGCHGRAAWSFAGQSGTDAWRVRPIQGEGIHVRTGE